MNCISIFGYRRFEIEQCRYGSAYGVIINYTSRSHFVDDPQRFYHRYGLAIQPRELQFIKRLV